ncbi:MAG: hypothetical protein KGJ59_14235 [Bacteroidota bacterium]|nr:hypothetical protein [Bacteroidota bacterium]
MGHFQYRNGLVTVPTPEKIIGADAHPHRFSKRSTTRKMDKLPEKMYISEKHEEATMTTVNINAVKDLYLMNVLYELHRAQEKIAFFERKYHTTYTDFEKSVRGKGKEQFEEWDDYMEWKAFVKAHHNLLQQKNDVENGNIKIS